MIAGSIATALPSLALAQEKTLWDRMADQFVCGSHAAMAAGDPERSAMRAIADKHQAASLALAEEVRRRASEGISIAVARPEERPALDMLLDAETAADGQFDAAFPMLERSSAVVNDDLMEEFGTFHLAAAAAHANAYEGYGCSELIDDG